MSLPTMLLFHPGQRLFWFYFTNGLTFWRSFNRTILYWSVWEIVIIVIAKVIKSENVLNFTRCQQEHCSPYNFELNCPDSKYRKSFTGKFYLVYKSQCICIFFYFSIKAQKSGIHVQFLKLVPLYKNNTNSDLFILNINLIKKFWWL